MNMYCLPSLLLIFVSLTQAFPSNAEDRSVTVVAPSGTITSAGYPNGYNSEDSEAWKFRVSGATSYTIVFNDMDLDSAGCYDYVTIYDDNDYSAPGRNFCNKPSLPVVIDSSRITVSFVTGSAFAAGKRGAGLSFSYSTNGNAVPPVDTTTTVAVTTTEVATEPPQTVVPTTPPPTVITTTTVVATTSTAPPSTTSLPAGGNFPPGTQDDSNCGNPVVKAVVTGLDYEAQGAIVSDYSAPSNRVVNGEAAVPHSWPWQVSLQGSYGSAYCGGTLIQPQWVVTAAHCADLIFIGTYGSDQAALGMHNKQVAEPSRQLIDIVAKFVHPQYDDPDRSHDVAMVKLATPAVLNDDVSLACEAHKGWSFPAGMQCVVTGWGVTVEGGNKGTNILQQAPLPLWDDQDCYDLYQEASLDTTPDMQCAGGQGKGACNGDSGGPLNCYVNNKWYHMGIVSFGEANCDTDIASVFARVAELRDFIDEIVETFS